MAKNPVVANYVAEFLRADQMPIYRQLTGLRHDFDVHVFARSRTNEAYYPYHEKWVHRLPAPRGIRLPRLIQALLSRRPQPISRSELRRWILDLTRVDAQLLHIHHGQSAPALLPLMKAWPRPVVVSFHGDDVAVGMDQPSHRDAMQEVIQRAALLLAPSQSLANALVALGAAREKVTVQRSCIPMDDWPYSPRATPEDGAWQLMQSCRFVEKKGLDTTLRAFAIIAKTYPQAKLLLVGEGPQRAQLDTLATELGIAAHVEFPGFRYFGNLRNHINASHVFLHPSRTAADGDREGVPNAMLEAMATGLPVIATKHGGIPEAITDGESGLLVGEGDHEALAAATLRVLADTALRQRLGKAGHHAVAQGFAQSVQSPRLAGIYRGLIERRR